MSEPDLICTDLGGGVTELSLTRAPVNALSPEMLVAISDLFDGMSVDDRVRAVVVRSPFASFSAGMDLKLAMGFDAEGQATASGAFDVAFASMFGFPKPCVVAVDGPAIAGGLFFVLSADYRVAGPRGRFGLAEVRVGVDFPIGPMEIARAMLAPNDLRRLMLTGQPIGVEAARVAGIVDEVVASDAVEARAVEMARQLAEIPADAYARVKHQIRGEVLHRIHVLREAADDAPEDWYTDDTRAAMRRMLGA